MGSKLQALRTSREGNDWVLGLEFFPNPGFVTLLRLRTGNETSIGFVKGKLTLTTAQHPLSLYLKAHFLNRRVAEARVDNGGLVLDMGEGYSLRFDAVSGATEVKIEATVPDRPPFRKVLQLALYSPPSAEGGVSTPLESRSLANLAPIDPALRKRERLKANIQSDFDEAQAWLDRLGPICLRLEQDPGLWMRPKDWTPEDLAALEPELAVGKLARPGSPGSARGVLEELFQRRRRAERKRTGAVKRLKDIESLAVKVAAQKARAQSGEIPSVRVEERPRKKPGVWVRLKEGLWARVGRSATENDELFRQSRDRDLWFHVHGGAGGHVWIPRGQKGFGSKTEPTDDIVNWGCQLALINSPAAKSGSATVQYCERRELRRLHDSPGKVEILRSKTRQVRLDEAFERQVMKGST